MASRFYINWPLAPGPVTLEGAEAHHLASVYRLRPGDAVCLFNGDGHEYPARIVAVAKRSIELEVLTATAPLRELPFTLEVAAPLPKGDRAQFLVEKLTELGVAVFVPLDCERCVIQPREAKLDKLQRYAIEASKQCGRNVLMRVEPMAAWQDYCTRRAPDEILWLAHPYGSVHPPAGHSAAQPMRLVVGPEGGFTDTEIEDARTNGWQLIDLGPRILRIETAALALVCRAIS